MADYNDKYNPAKLKPAGLPEPSEDPQIEKTLPAIDAKIDTPLGLSFEGYFPILSVLTDAFNTANPSNLPYESNLSSINSYANTDLSGATNTNSLMNMSNILIPSVYDKEHLGATNAYQAFGDSLSKGLAVGITAPGGIISKAIFGLGAAALTGASHIMRNSTVSDRQKLLSNILSTAKQHFADNLITQNKFNNLNDYALHMKTGNIVANGGKLDFTTSANILGLDPLVFASVITSSKLEYPYGGQMPLSGDFSNGVKKINVGGTHEENPNGGVPLGIAPDGLPNLVELGELIWNDYVFSNRLVVPEDFKKQYKMGGSISTFADAADFFLRESEDRPNDVISARTKDNNLTILQQLLELIKADNEMQEAQLMWDNLTPEEQAGVIELSLVTLLHPVLEEAVQELMLPDNQIMLEPTEEDVDMRLSQVAQSYDQDMQTFAKGGHLYPYGSWIYDKKSKSYNPYYTLWLNSINLDLVDLINATLKTNYSLENIKKLGSDGQVGKVHKALEPYFKSFYLGSGAQDIYNKDFAPSGWDWTVEYPSSTRTDLTFNYPYRNVLNQNVAPKQSDPYEGSQDVVKAGDYSNTSKTEVTKNKSNTNSGSVYINPAYLRYAPAFGSLLQVIADAVGKTNNNDYSNADRIDYAASTIRDIAAQPFGQYATYTPYDYLWLLALLYGLFRAAQDAISNSAAGNRAAANVGTLANAYNAATAIGELAAKNRLAEDARYLDILKNNNALSLAIALLGLNAQEANLRSDILRANTYAIAAKLRLDIYDRNDDNRTNNYSNLFLNLGSLGDSEYYLSILANNPALAEAYKAIMNA